MTVKFFNKESVLALLRTKFSANQYILVLCHKLNPLPSSSDYLVAFTYDANLLNGYSWKENDEQWNTAGTFKYLVSSKGYAVFFDGALSPKVRAYYIIANKEFAIVEDFRSMQENKGWFLHK